MILSERRAIDIAMAALGIEVVYTNSYRCDECEVGWEFQWSSACSDTCPDCGGYRLPYQWATNLEGDGE